MTSEFDSMIACRDAIRATHVHAATTRELHNDDWIVRERLVVTERANAVAAAHGLNASVTVDDVERIEQTAVGHVDYVDKLALRIAQTLIERHSTT